VLVSAGGYNHIAVRQIDVFIGQSFQLCLYVFDNNRLYIVKVYPFYHSRVECVIFDTIGHLPAYYKGRDTNTE